MTITFSDLTDNVVVDASYVITGDGVFDKLMETVNLHLDAQYKLGRITGVDYANVYLGALQATIQQSVTFLLNSETTNAQVALTQQKEITEWAQTKQTSHASPAADSILGRQSEMLRLQTLGFKWNADNKHLQSLIQAWSINTTTGGIPVSGIDAINATGTDNLNEQIADAKPTL